MLEIFKYFVGIIAVLILAYVLIVVIRTVILTGFITTSEVASSTMLQGTASGTNSLVNGLKNFSLAALSEWLLNHRLISISPIYVGYDQENAGYSFFGNNEGKGFKTQQQLYWQNLNDAPNDHPTDWVPVNKSYVQSLIDSQDGGVNVNYNENRNEIINEEDMKTNPDLIKPNLKTGGILNKNDVITGKAFYKVFSQRVFPIYILDRDGNTISQIKAFANGDIGPDGMVAFRAVLGLRGNRIPYGFLMFKNENFEMSQIKAVTLVPVLFNN